MSITDELRTGGIYRFPSNRRVFTEEELTAIADRIDAEHEAACAEAYGNGVMSVPIALDESAWIKLPVDADGVPISIGDEVTEHEDGYTFKVDGFMCWDGEWWVFQRDAIQAPARRCTHHHAPTVEDVLRECCYKYHSLLVDDMNDAINGVERDYIAPDEIIAEFAAKLRLAKEGE